VPFDPYELLAVDRGASADEIRRAYRALARQYHPDVNPDPAAGEHFKALSLAYSVLADPKKRELFDHYGEESMTLEFQQNVARREAAAGQFHPPSPLDVVTQIEIDRARAESGATMRMPSPVGGSLVVVRIPKGVQHGTRLRLLGKGRAAPGQRPGDLYVEIRVREG
jgi:DnaJ-class molecular chaperone